MISINVMGCFAAIKYCGKRVSLGVYPSARKAHEVIFGRRGWFTENTRRRTNMVWENDGKLDADAAQVGCYGLAIAHFDPTITDDQFDLAWDMAKVRGFLDSSDTLVNPQGFVNILGYALTFRDGHFPADTPLDPAKMHIIGKWVSGDKTHFVVHANGGTSKEDVTYDPIEGGSLTVKEGTFDSFRIFDKVY